MTNLEYLEKMLKRAIKNAEYSVKQRPNMDESERANLIQKVDALAEAVTAVKEVRKQYGML
jgi:hypothetical protein